jgi:hypothetical protein
LNSFRWAALVAAPALSVLLLAGCGPKSPAPTVNASMTQVMAPHAQTVWDATSRAFNARGDGLDGAKLSAQDWAEIGKAGAAMRDRALVLAAARRLTVTAPGERIMGEEAAPAGTTKKTWDAANAKQIQALIDKNPALFAQHARQLAFAGDTLVRASRTRDVHALYSVSSNLDEVCDGCHQPFWGTDEPPPFPK